MTSESTTGDTGDYGHESKLEHEQQEYAVVESNTSPGWLKLWSEEHQVQSRLLVRYTTVRTIVFVMSSGHFIQCLHIRDYPIRSPPTGQETRIFRPLVETGRSNKCHHVDCGNNRLKKIFRITLYFDWSRSTTKKSTEEVGSLT